MQFSFLCIKANIKFHDWNAIAYCIFFQCSTKSAPLWITLACVITIEIRIQIDFLIFNDKTRCIEGVRNKAGVGFHVLTTEIPRPSKEDARSLRAAERGSRKHTIIGESKQFHVKIFGYVVCQIKTGPSYPLSAKHLFAN